MNDLITGFRYVLQGFKLILKPRIRRFVLIPLLINTILFAAALTYGASAMSDFIDSYLTGWLEWLRWILWPLFVVVALTVVFFCFSIFANLLAAPFNGFLAESVEDYLTGERITQDGAIKQLPGEIIKSIKSESRKFLYFLVRAIPLLLLFVIPVINIAAPFLWILFGAWMLALEYADFPMGNHGILFPEQRETLKQKRPLAFGFGLGVLVITLIPVVNFIAIPVAVCGATKMWVERLHPV